VATPVHASDGDPVIDQGCTTSQGCFAGGEGGPPETSSEPYFLTADSAWLEGCIVGVCLCPVASTDDLTGAFVLVELPTLGPGPWRLFEVLDLHWSLGRGEIRVDIRGRGLYQTAAPVLDQHRLVLDLELDGDPIGTLDSGVVPGAAAFPEIHIQALTAGDCYQEGVQLAAAPVPEPALGLQQLAGLMTLLCLSQRRTKRRRPKLGAP